MIQNGCRESSMSESQRDRARVADEKHELARERDDQAGRGGDKNEMWEARRDLIVAEQDVIIADLLNRVEALEESMQVLLAAQEQDVEHQMMLDSQPDA
jgi:hypothetical protein